MCEQERGHSKRKGKEEEGRGGNVNKLGRRQRGELGKEGTEKVREVM